MSDIKIKYTGDLRTAATHISSGSKIITDAIAEAIPKKTNSFIYLCPLFKL